MNNKKGFITSLILIIVGMLLAGGFLINGFSFNKEDGLSLPTSIEKCKLNFLPENETGNFFCEGMTGECIASFTSLEENYTYLDCNSTRITEKDYCVCCKD
ncbi:hypothetical protein HOD61_03385 [archaeon]|jgi:hypothetical protein|nr:hypothetical protein [archaeon]